MQLTDMTNASYTQAPTPDTHHSAKPLTEGPGFLCPADSFTQLEESLPVCITSSHQVSKKRHHQLLAFRRMDQALVTSGKSSEWTKSNSRIAVRTGGMMSVPYEAENSGTVYSGRSVLFNQGVNAQNACNFDIRSCRNCSLNIVSV